MNPEAFRGRGVFRIFAEEGTALYRGWGWTMARNAPGSFALFGGSAFTKEYILGVSDYSKATWTQNFIASVGGAVASITVAAPLDVVKTRIQNANFEKKVSGVKVVKDLLKNEGPGAFFKGLTPKVRSILAYPDGQGLILYIDPRCWTQARVQLHPRTDPHPSLLSIRLSVSRLCEAPHHFGPS